MVKKYIAFHGSSNSGIHSREKVIEWATEMLNGTKVSKVHVAELVETVERVIPAVEVKPYVPFEGGDEKIAKAA